VNDRPYRSGRRVDDALAILAEGAGTQWDPEVVGLLQSEMPVLRALGAA
jgi:HD-GYP domain-containing protein (c-di-GMP phosphodiesterase class II)